MSNFGGPLHSFAAEVIRRVKEADSGSTFHLEIPNGIVLPGGIPVYLQVTKRDVRINEDLADSERTEVALGIFQAMENASEEGWAQRISGSSYSEEDLISNLLSFYLAVGGQYTLENIRSWCGYLTEDQSIEVYDWYKKHLGFEKVKKWGKLRLATCSEGRCGFLHLFPCEEKCPLDKYCPGERKFPTDKFNIAPEPEGDKWEFVEEP